MDIAIRNIQLQTPAVLAPMEGVTDVMFRRLIRSVGGCGLTVTEFIPAKALKEKHKKALQMAEFDEDEHPVSIQVYGRDPAMLAEAAKYVVDLGADIVDLNMGCPSKRVCKRSGGSSLMKEPDVARQIVAAMRAAVQVPFTVKMRAGWNSELRNAPEIAWMCQEEGAEMVTVHWRTREDGYKGVQDWDIVREVKDRLSIPVLANGDIVDVETALRAHKETGCDGVMIGRGAIKDPWVFRKIEAKLKGLPEPIVDRSEKKRVLLDYYHTLIEKRKYSALGRMKQMIRYFTEGVEDGARLREMVFHSHSIEEALANVHVFFDGE